MELASKGFKETEHKRDNAGKFAVGDHVRRSKKIKAWSDEKSPHNYGMIMAAQPGKDNHGKAARGYLVRSDAQAQTLINSKADHDDYKDAEQPTWYHEAELEPAKRAPHTAHKKASGKEGAAAKKAVETREKKRKENDWRNDASGT